MQNHYSKNYLFSLSIKTLQGAIRWEILCFQYFIVSMVVIIVTLAWLNHKFNTDNPGWRPARNCLTLPGFPNILYFLLLFKRVFIHSSCRSRTNLFYFQYGLYKAFTFCNDKINIFVLCQNSF